MWLGEQGFERLNGFDIDLRAIKAGMEISEKAHLPLNLWVDDGLLPKTLPDIPCSAILALNWTFLVDGFLLDKYIGLYLPYLEEYGTLIFDIIDFSIQPITR